MTTPISPSARLTAYSPVSPTTNFPVNFPLFDNDDLLVTVEGETRTDFTVTATYTDGISTDAVVVMSIAVTGDVFVAGMRDPSRTDQFVTGGPLPINNFNYSLNRLEIEMQEARRDLQRAYKTPFGTGDAAEFTAEDIENAAENAASALQSKEDAEASASAAATSESNAAASAETAQEIAESINLPTSLTASTVLMTETVGAGRVDKPFPDFRKDVGLPVIVTSIAALKALDTSKDTVAFLKVANSERIWRFEPTSQTANVTSDPNNAIYVAPASDPTGASGAWVAVVSATVKSEGPTIAEFGAIGDGSSSNNAINNAAFAAAKAWVAAQPNGGNVRIPQGNFKVNATIDLSVTGYKLKGSGPSARIVSEIASGNIFNIAGSGGVKITGVEVDVSTESNVTHTAGALYRLISAAGTKLKVNGGRLGSSFRQLAVIGDATYADDVTETEISGYFSTNGGDNCIELVSGSILFLWRMKLNGSGISTEAAIIQKSTTRNWDGLYVTDVVAEKFPTLLNVQGIGLSNFSIKGVTTDTNKAGSVIFAPSAGGVVKQGVIEGNSLQGAPAVATSHGIIFDLTTGSIFDIEVGGNDLFDYGGRAIYQKTAGLLDTIITRNKVRDCGQQSTPAMTFNTASGLIVDLNVIRDTLGTHKMTYGYEWGGTSGNRSFGIGPVFNAVTAASIGTP